MIVLEQLVLETGHYASGALGTHLSLGGFIIVIMITGLVVAAMAFFMWDRGKKSKNIKAIQGKVLLEIAPQFGGIVQRLLVEEFKGEAKVIEDKSRATFTVSSTAKVPQGTSVVEYFLVPEHDYMDRWPETFFKSQQVVVTKYYFKENDPFPQMPHDASKWDDDRRTRITATMAKLAKDESNLQVLVSEMSGVWQNIAEFVERLKAIPQIRLLQFVIIALLLIIGFIAFRSMSAANNVMHFLLGGK